MSVTAARLQRPAWTLVVLCLLLSLSPVGRARGESADPTTPALRPGEMQSGALLLKTSEGYVEAVRLGTDVKLTVSGPTARAQVTQAFTNPTGGWVEAVYVYPLSDGGGVDSLKMVIGDRIVVGEIKPRDEARSTFEAAKEAGLRASLVEQERPNIFTTSVANVGPGETVLVQIEYQEPVRFSGGVYSLRVPLVVAPRYSPEGGSAGDPVPDRTRLTSPVIDSRTHGPTNPVSISVRLQPGFTVGSVASAYHPVDVRQDGTQGRIINLTERRVPANRDFELTWKPAASATPAASLFYERVAGQDYVLAYVTPPTRAPFRRLPRETVFVIDNSGSMAGESMGQAKQSLLYGLSRLGPGDRFNVVRFDHSMEMLFPDAVPADAVNLARARRFVSGLSASGGTEMLPAMHAALTDRNPRDDSHVRQVVFLTDGAIGNEQGLFDEIAARRGRSRVFMVGIGSAPNSHLMTRAAELGRGTFTHIGAAHEVEERMRELFNKLESPVATNLVASFSGVQADATPALLPDLYQGEPVMLAARIGGRRGVLTISGTLNGRPWSSELRLADAAPGVGISQVWARRKVDDAEVAATLRQITIEQRDEQILALGLEHHLVTRLTSLVAVDRTPARPAGEGLRRSDVPIELPAGWDFDKLFSPSIGKAGSVRPDSGQIAQAVELPQGATDAQLRLIAGLSLGLAGLALIQLARRRPAAA